MIVDQRWHLTYLYHVTSSCYFVDWKEADLNALYTFREVFDVPGGAYQELQKNPRHVG